MVERQDPDNFPCVPTQEICAWKLAAYVLNVSEVRVYCNRFMYNCVAANCEK